MRTQYELKCPNCGAKVLSISNDRHCYKCDNKMDIVKKTMKDYK